MNSLKMFPKLQNLSKLKEVAATIKMQRNFSSDDFSDQPRDRKLEKTINQVSLLGRVGNEPVKKGNQEHPVVVFSLATHSNYKYESGELLEKTDWHRICVFKPSLREVVFNYMKKGQRVYVNGRISYGSVTENSTLKTATSIIADEIIFFSQGESEL